MTSPELRILTVCTGNICRSPAAEYLLREAFGPAVEVRSAGTRAVVGHPVDAQMAAILPMDTSGFAARQLKPDMIRHADLVIGLAREHRSRIVDVHPAAVRRAFTLRELTRILQLPEFLGQPTPSTPGAALKGLIPRAAMARARARVRHAADDDVADPYGRSDDDFSTALAQITEAVTIIREAAERQSSA